jgi:ADP-ribose pyrophosphatase
LAQPPEAERKAPLPEPVEGRTPAPSETPSSERRNGRHLVFETPWFQVEAVPDRDGSMERPYYRLISGEGVIALPMTDAGELVLVEQYRPTLGAVTVEFPAGGREPHESECQAAARETWEETGYLCDFWVPLAPGRMFLNRTDHRDYFVLGLGARPDPAWRADHAEVTAPHLLSRERFLERVRADMFEHTAALAAFTIAEAKLGLHLLTDPVGHIRARLVTKGQRVELPPVAESVG